MKKLLLAILALACSCAELAAVTYEWSQGTRACRLNIPDSIAGNTLRGIIIYGNGADGDSRSMATNSELVAWAESMRFCIIATSEWDYLNGTEPSIWETQLAYFATQSGHPEIEDAPWIPIGFSNGGQMSFGFNALWPEKTIGVITAKGQFYITSAPGPLALRTPGVLIAGETTGEAARMAAIKKLFTNNRPRGALWGWVEEENTGHSDNNAPSMVYPLMEECVRLRYPAGASPLNGPVQLKDLHEGDGWLVDFDLDVTLRGTTEVKAADDETGDPRAFGWMPNSRMAHVFRAFSSYGKVGAINTGSSTGNGAVINFGNTLTYRVNLSAGTWDSIEFFQGDQSLGTVLPGGADGDSPRATMTAQYGGYHVFFGVVTKPDDSQACTPIRRVFVKGPERPTAYETWAAVNLPAGERDPQDDPTASGISNITRFALGMGTGGDRSLLPELTEFVTVGTTKFAEFRYKYSEAAREGGVNLMPSQSSDMVNWTRSLPGEGSFLQYTRDGDDVTVRVPIASTSGSNKILMDLGEGSLQTTTQDPANTWNNILGYALDAVTELVDSAGGLTGVQIRVTASAFTSIHSDTSMTPGYYVPNATRDSFYYDNGKVPQFTVTGLDPAQTYSFKFFGARKDTSGTPLVRSTKYTVTGANNGSVVHNCTTVSNVTQAPGEVANISPKPDGSITIDLAADLATNTSTSKVGYLGVIEINASVSFVPKLPGDGVFLRLEADDRE